MRIVFPTAPYSPSGAMLVDIYGSEIVVPTNLANVTTSVPVPVDVLNETIRVDVAEFSSADKVIITGTLDTVGDEVFYKSDFIVATASTYESITINPGEGAYFYYVNHLAMHNGDHSTGTAAITLGHTPYTIELAIDFNIPTRKLLFYPNSILLLPDDTITFHWENITVGDHLVYHILARKVTLYA